MKRKEIIELILKSIPLRYRKFCENKPLIIDLFISIFNVGFLIGRNFGDKIDLKINDTTEN